MAYCLLKICPNSTTQKAALPDVLATNNKKIQAIDVIAMSKLKITLIEIINLGRYVQVTYEKFCF